MSPVQVAAAILVPLIWGIQYAIIKTGLAVFPPLFFAGLRFAAVAAILVPFAGRPSMRELRSILFISIFMGGMNFGCVFVGLTRAPAGIAGVANQLWTPFTLLLAWPLLGERPSLRVAVGVVVAIGGVALAVVDPAATVPIVPILFVIGSAVGLAVGNVAAKKLGPFDPVRLFAWISLFTVPQLCALSVFAEHGQLDALHRAALSEWLAFAFTIVFGGIVAFTTWFWLIARLSMPRVAPYALLQAFFSIAAGVLFRHERLTPALATGAIMCVAGVAMTQLRAPRSRPIEVL